MGKIDVISAIFESFGLIRAHYKEVALPLVILLILSGAGHLGSNLGGNGFGSNSNSPHASSGTANALANAVPGPEALAGLLSMLVGVVLIFLVIFIILAIIVALVDQAAWFYVFEHFYALLGKKKVQKDWKNMFQKQIIKALVIWLFWLALIAALSAVPAVLFIGNSPFALGVAILALIALLVLAFLLQPTWVYFAMDGMGIMAAAGKSVELVKNNAISFLVFGFIMLLTGCGIAVASLFITLACCLLAPIVMPFIEVLFGLIFGITMMKMKIALEK